MKTLLIRLFLLFGISLLGLTANHVTESGAELLAKDYCYKTSANEDIGFQECPECDDDDVCEGIRGGRNQSITVPNVAIKVTDYGKCMGNADITGVALQSDPNLVLYKACHDKLLWKTYWTLHKIDGTKSFESLPSGETPSDFDKYPFHENDDLLKTYIVANQLITVRKQLTTADEYFTQYADGRYCWFAKGHLLPCADMNTKDQRKATFNLINVFPQWQGINNRNWKMVENRVRKRSFSPTKKVLRVSTGTHGNLVLPDKPVEKPVWLNVNANNVGDKNPAQMYVWKVVYEEDLAIVTINSMHIEESDVASLVFCPDVCENLEYAWIVAGFPKSTRQNLRRGYTFCCKLAEFKKTVTYVPPPELHGF